MKKIIAATCILSLLNLATLQAGPIEKKKPFTSTEIVDFSHLQVASAIEVREVEAGFLGAASSLINLAIYGAMIYGGYKLSEAIRGDD
ncbi:MAG: hypothetical protein ACI8XO_004215 [Verrucomicrobiales bacterium]|jgi:hypothetical protein